MGSEETHPTSSVHEDILAASAEETVVADPLNTQTATEEEPEIPQPEVPEIAIPEIMMQLTDTSASMYSSQITTPMILLA